MDKQNWIHSSRYCNNEGCRSIFPSTLFSLCELLPFLRKKTYFSSFLENKVNRTKIKRKPEIKEEWGRKENIVALFALLVLGIHIVWSKRGIDAQYIYFRNFLACHWEKAMCVCSHSMWYFIESRTKIRVKTISKACRYFLSPRNAHILTGYVDTALQVGYLVVLPREKGLAD